MQSSSDALNCLEWLPLDTPVEGSHVVQNPRRCILNEKYNATKAFSNNMNLPPSKWHHLRNFHDEG